ncbi:putative Dol-P-Glc:Glc(2)Man(9)GlcNAc(2)-PP-Dol alpha-1,2-glucosyltransferase [Macrosteles quadrilineatus]|uniref:putative Dol-P-Glc:Glc(2)Man(9)GlcNAc(2)-PP-Dol alpha-1,2-glucosyltransferase n=1 Tax=Macrosteles quadrilineatus TaxID=74068 RepID=UPI0023E20046|nr:putative Dol-P-Glc:Glc(2)Man(9)GlcNAc(2)-PP-Dol alpha-1,2-glucosyltransferase [Macrosteles quadrilineatus]
MKHKYFFVCAGLFFSLSVGLFTLVYSAQTKPFIDEIFHIPQTIKYCRGQFDEWDPKITTLPGLYFVSVGVLMPLSAVTGLDLCCVFGLRAINLVVSVVNFYLIYKITKLLHPNVTEEWKVLMTAANLALLPPLYFFTFLYYTDTVSTCLVLLCYLLHLRKRPWLSAIAGFMSVVTRQTNIIWVAFFTLEAIVEFLKDEAVWRRKKKITNAVESSFKYLQVLNFAASELMRQDSYRIGHFIGRVLADVIGYVFVGLSFLIFVAYNRSIVVGDKSAHSVTLHFPQLLYFALFASIFAWPLFIVKVRQFFQAVLIRRMYYVVALGLCVLAIHFNSMAHPYLLADNRHYTFYIWKRLLSKDKLRDLVIPWYIFGLYCIQDCIKHKSIIFQIAYWGCIVLNLVPQKLLEFRYFIVPYLMFRLQAKPGLFWQLLFEMLLALAINIATVVLFVTKTFYWTDSAEPQRFIW